MLFGVENNILLMEVFFSTSGIVFKNIFVPDTFKNVRAKLLYPVLGTQKTKSTLNCSFPSLQRPIPTGYSFYTTIMRKPRLKGIY